MTIELTKFKDLFVVNPQTFHDDRGYFLESFNQKSFMKTSGLDIEFVQDNHSFSKKHVLRGIHYQVSTPQSKLVRVIRGSVFDVAVDLRQSSPTFKQWLGIKLSQENMKQLFIPKGFGHAFLALEDAEVLYKTSDYYSPRDERTLYWNDPEIGIDWPVDPGSVILSAKDQQGQRLKVAELFP